MAFHLQQASPSPTPDLPETNPQIEELYSAWALTILCGLLILSLWTSYYVQIKRIRAIHETVLAVFFGMFVGLVIRLSPGHLIREMLTFKHTVFFNLLLPPIILNSGYELKQENFFRNFGSILTFAFLGTFISSVGIGVLTYVYSFLSVESLNVSLLDCLIFGSTLSATDPVTILAIFNQYKVDPKLYSVIFGESLLNDAVSIVMYETLSQFNAADIYVSSIFHGVGIFLFSFCSSMALGVCFGLGCSLILKHSSLHQYHGIESCLVALIAYTSYFFSTAMHMSGIVSLLFCGITLKHYAYHTMSRRTQRTTKYMFAVLAQLSENFIFIYLGLNLFTQDVQVFKPLFILVTTVIVCATRYAAVFPLSELINFFHRAARGQRYEELPHSYQMMLFWAGLRGAVGVALAAGFQGENADALRTTVLVVVVLTLIVFGGTTARMLDVLGIRMGVEDGGDGDSSDDGAAVLANGLSSHGGDPWSANSPGSRPNGRRWESRGIRLGGPHLNGRLARSLPSRHASGSVGSGPIGSMSDDSDAGEVLPAASGAQSSSGRPLTGEFGADGKWFTALDERYLLPLFSNSVASRKFHARRARRAAYTDQGGEASPDLGFDTDDEQDTLLESTSSPRPRPRSMPGPGPAGGDFSASMTDFFRSLRGQATGGATGGSVSGSNTPGGGGLQVGPTTPTTPTVNEFRSPSRGAVNLGDSRWGEDGIRDSAPAS